MMGREKQGYRDTIEELNRLFPNKGMLEIREVAQYMGCSVRTVQRTITYQGTRITKADLARQVCL